MVRAEEGSPDQMPATMEFFMSQPILTVKNITKTYPGVTALNDVTMTFEKGEIHALLGENGAGKSTLIKVIAGAVEPDSGHVVIDGREFAKMSPHLAKENGIEVIYQEFSLVEALSVAQNVFLGENQGWLVDHMALQKRAQKIFDEMNVHIDPAAQVRKLSPAKKQLVEIAKAISRNAKILIMDEPSAPLSASEVETMFEIVGKMKARGVTIIYISHRIEELFRISDRVSVMRDGCYVDTLVTKQTNRRELINLMVGRELKEYYPNRTQTPSEVVLDVKNISGFGDENISFNVRRGRNPWGGWAGWIWSDRTCQHLVWRGPQGERRDLDQWNEKGNPFAASGDRIWNRSDSRRPQEPRLHPQCQPAVQYFAFGVQQKGPFFRC